MSFRNQVSDIGQAIWAGVIIVLFFSTLIAVGAILLYRLSV